MCKTLHLKLHFLQPLQHMLPSMRCCLFYGQYLYQNVDDNKCCPVMSSRTIFPKSSYVIAFKFCHKVIAKMSGMVLVSPYISFEVIYFRILPQHEPYLPSLSSAKLLATRRLTVL